MRTARFVLLRYLVTLNLKILCFAYFEGRCVPSVASVAKRQSVRVEKCTCISVIGCAALPLLWRFSCMIDLKYFIKLDYQSIGACSQLKQRPEEMELRY